MRISFLKGKLSGVFLAGILAAAAVSAVPSVEISAGVREGTGYARRSFDSSYDSENAYSGSDLGCTYTPAKTTFKVWSPEASSVVLCRYEKGNGGSIIGEVPMTKDRQGVWSAEVTGDIVNTYYTYKVTAEGTTEEAVDIYAKAAGVNGDRAMVVDLDSTDPDHWDQNYQREKTLLSDIIVWEIHIRDFSIDVSSGVSQQNRGKYKAFTERTTINGEGRTASCVDYLKELGVTHVQLLPMYDYASVDETNVSTNPGTDYSWGYDPKNYNVPEGSYSSDPYDGNVRIKEMKEMIQALHDADIKVIMDVSYSHTYDAGDSNFNKIMPDYYYKLNDDLSYRDQSGYGNATRSESAMFRKFMIDSVSYWAEEYNLDGFRFDLMGIHDMTTMNQIRKALDSKFGKNTIVLYGEGQTGDGTYDSNSAHKANESKLDYGIGYYNEQIREALKGGDTFDGTIGLLQTNYFGGDYLEPDEKWPNNVFGGIMGSVGYTTGEWGMWRPFWSKSSNCCLSNVSSHNNLTLWDKLAEGFEKNFSSVDDQMKRMNKMAGGVVLVSKGGVFMQAGEEFARTKEGEDNSGSSPDSVNKIDWNRVNTYSDIQKYYQGMIRIRKAFSGFRSTLERSDDNWNPTDNNIQWISKEEAGMTAFYETNDVPGEWDRIAVLINNKMSDQTITLTGSEDWVIIADGTESGLEKIKETGADITVPGKSVVVAVPKDTFTLTGKVMELKDLIQQAEEKGYQEKDFTAKVYIEFENALVNAKEAAGKKEADGAVIQEAWDRLNKAYENISTEAVAKERLAGAFEKAKTKLAAAEKDTADYDAESVADLKTVIADVQDFMKSVYSAEEYQSKEEDLEYAVRACTELGGDVPEPDKTVLREQIARAEKVIEENPDSINLAALKKSYDAAKTVDQDAAASQVDINKSVRALKKSIRAVLDGSAPDPVEPDEDPKKPDKEPSTQQSVQTAKKLEITKLTIGKASGTAQAGDNISISVWSTGGTGVVKYRFFVKKGSPVIIRNNSTSRSAKWKPKKAGKYSITVYAVDEKGKTAEKTISGYVVNSKLKVSRFVASPSSKKARAGKKVKLTVKASGGTKKYQYKFGYKKSGAKKVKKICNYKGKKTVKWRPKASGKYTLYVYVRDRKTKRIAKKTIKKFIIK